MGHIRLPSGPQIIYGKVFYQVGNSWRGNFCK